MNSHTTDTHPSPPRRRGRPRGRQTGAPAHAYHAPRPDTPPLAPAPCDTTPVAFTSLPLDARLLEGIRDLGYVETRPVQSAVIPLALAGEDLIVCAETGTGKTAAFAVPMLQCLIDKRASLEREASAEREAEPAVEREASAEREAEPSAVEREASAERPPRSRVLVLAPTRELAVQIEDEIHGLGYHTAVSSAAVFGGVEMGGQERALRAGVDVIVATPGRLMDHMRQQNADLAAIELLVLDEADRMMDMGFWPDVRRIIAALPAARQTLLFSATLPDEVVRDALEITRDRRYVQIGRRSAPARTITHRVAAVDSGGAKLAWLVDHLRRPEGPVLVFSRTKIGADRLARRLAAAGIRCAALHADRTMDQRRQAVEGFRAGRYKVLVATDIAARGLDIDGIHTVINYEVPDSPETYVHRVGRTGRANEAGRAITIVAPDERRALAVLEKGVGVRLE